MNKPPKPEVSYDQKSTNPKDAIGVGKLPLDLVPDTGIAYAALAFLEGALKYGKFNWRIAGVRWSVYEAAFERHRMKLAAGEWEDPDTGVPHLASMIACLFILLDAKEAGKLTDDRPPRVVGFSKFIDNMTAKVARLKKVFSKYDPKQYTIDDGVEGYKYERTGEPVDNIGPQTAASIAALRKDVQSLPGRDSGRVVFGHNDGPMGGMEVAFLSTQKEEGCACPVCATDSLAKKPGSGGTER